MHIQLISQNFPSRRWRHASFRAQISELHSDLDHKDGTFEVKPALNGAPGCVSFESSNFPDHYLRHKSFEIWLDRNDGSAAFVNGASWRICPGLADFGGVTFESVDFPGHFIRHSSFLLRMDKNDGGDVFKSDATFYTQTPHGATVSLAATFPAVPAAYAHGHHHGHGSAAAVAPGYPGYPAPGASAYPAPAAPGYPGYPATGGAAAAYPGYAPVVPAAAPARPPDVTMRLRSQNFPTKHFRHYGADNQVHIHDLDGPESVKQSVVYARPGLTGAPGTVSFEIFDFPPGHFLAHWDYQVKVKRDDGSAIHHANATFIVRPGLGDGAGGVSFESTNFPGHFIRHASFLLRLDKNDGSDLFKADATFYGLSGRDGSAMGIPAIMVGATPVAPAYPAYPGVPGAYPGAGAYPAPAAPVVPAAAPARPPDVTMRLRSQNFPTKHWRHYGKDEKVKVDDLDNAESVKQSVVYARPGLTGAPGTVSFEIFDYPPGHYIAVVDEKIKVMKDDHTPEHHAHATFVLRPGMGDAASGVSVESTRYPGHFIRHSSFKLKLERFDGGEGFKADATWTALSGRDGSVMGIPAIMVGATPVAPAYPAYPAGSPGGYPGSPGAYPGAAGAPAYPGYPAAGGAAAMPGYPAYPPAYDASWIAKAAAGAWEKEDGGLKHVSIGSDDHIIGTNTSSEVWKKHIGGGWEKVPGGLVQVDSADSHRIVGVNAGSEIWRMTPAGWEHLPGGAVWASIGSDGTIWVVNAGHEIYRWEEPTRSWTHIPGAASTVSVGDRDNVWVTNAADEIYKWTGAGWERIPGGLRRVAVSAGGRRVVGVNASKNIFAWNPSTKAWTAVPGGLDEIAVSDHWIVGANSAMEIYRLRL